MGPIKGIHGIDLCHNFVYLYVYDTAQGMNDVLSVNVKSSPTTRHGGAWGVRRYSSYSFSTSALDGGEWSASCPGRAFTPGESTGGWVDPRAGLDTEARGNILWPRRGSNPDRPVVQPVVRHYTTWANPSPVMWQEPVFTHWAVLRHWVRGLRFTDYRANIHGTRLVCTLQALMEMWSSVREETRGWTDRRRDEHITHCTFMLYTFGAKNIQMPRRGCVLYKLHTEFCRFSRIFQGPFFLHYTVPISDFVFNFCFVPCQNPFTTALATPR
jgi:hypothetical protein